MKVFALKPLRVTRAPSRESLIAKSFLRTFQGMLGLYFNLSELEL
jgi:hypothetical protein